MMKLTIAAAAFAAGMMTFAAMAQEAPELSKADAGKLTGGTKEDNARSGETVTVSIGGEFVTYPVGRNAGAKAALDMTKTASITARVKPELKATARKEVKGNRTATSAGGSYHAIISRYAASYGVPVLLAHAVIRIESNYRVNARGSAGEIGLMQIKPSTARMMGYGGSTKGLFNPETNIKYGMKYLAMAHQLGGGSTCRTILKYNAGHAAKRMNPVSAAYCSKVKRHLGA